MSYYHLTKGLHLPSIVNEGLIRTTLISDEKKEKPAVWLTQSTDWDNACNANELISPLEAESEWINKIFGKKDRRLNFSEMRSILGLSRIKIKESLPVTTWAKYKYVGGISENFYTAFDKASREIGSPTDLWGCSFKPISIEYFESIEMMVGDEWVKWDGSFPIEKFVELCHSCNGEGSLPELVEPTVPKYVNGQMDFIVNHEHDLIKLWEENKHKKGYLNITVMGDYDTMFSQFVEGKFWRKNFLKLAESKSGNYIYVQFNWFDTKTSYKACLAYEPETGFVMLNM